MGRAGGGSRFKAQGSKFKEVQGSKPSPTLPFGGRELPTADSRKIFGKIMPSSSF